MTWKVEIEKELQRLTGAGVSLSKKRNCIIGIIERRLIGEAYDTADFWKQKQTPSRRTFYKWKEEEREGDGVFTEVLKACWEIAQEAQTAEALTEVERAMRMMRLASPEAAATLISLMEDDNHWLRRAASNDILDRLEETADKGGLKAEDHLVVYLPDNGRDHQGDGSQ